MENAQTMNFARMCKLYRTEAKYELLKTIRSPSFAIPAILFPVMFYLFFGVIFNHGNVQAATYMLATYGTFGVIGPALFTFGVGLAIERGQGWLDIKEASPMPPSAQILARILVAMLFSLIIVISLSLIAWSLANVQLALWQWLTLTTILVVGGLPFCVFGLTLGLVLKSNAAPAIVNLIYLPVSFFSGLWIPISMFPDIMQTIAWFLPPHHLAQLALSVTGHAPSADVWQHILVLSVFSVTFFVLALMAYRKKDKQ
jgi:ABC-2 type transport system permease protein